VGGTEINERRADELLSEGLISEGDAAPPASNDEH